jgi:TRAP-type C4-dicarboxylate transport system permease small subunit
MAILTRVFTVIAALCLVTMMGIMVVDVFLRLIWNAPLFGKVEIISFFLVVTVYFGMAETFFRDEQVTVDVIDQMASPRVIGYLRLLGALLGTILLVLLTWRGIEPALDTLDFGDATMDLRISLFWYWVPILIGLGMAALAMLVFLVRLFLSRDRGTGAPHLGDGSGPE